MVTARRIEMPPRINLTKKYRAASWLDKPQWFEMVGEYRPPKKGEYYVSGAIPEVYQAPNDLSQNHQIARPVEDPPRFISVNGFTYCLSK